MSDWNEGYFTDSDYIYGYYRDISPTYQRFCLLAAGFSTLESDENSAHCELGYGQGVSINIHAAANPGFYFGTDFNPSHAAHANEMLAASKADAKFFEDSFEQMLERDDLPQFDSISLHGIWSWVSSENQKNIVEFARRFLKPGGTFYNSYNCFPGWSTKAPMRELFAMYDKYARHSSNTYNRVEEALKFTKELFDTEPIYLKHAPIVKQAFEYLQNMDHTYLAHEYFNRNWICMYFSDMAEILSEAKLDYACKTSLIDLLDEFTFPQNVKDFLNKIENPIMKEQTRDYFVNNQFRKDLYVKGLRRLSPSERSNRLLNTRYILLTTNGININIQSGGNPIVLPENIYKPLLEYLSQDNYAPKNLNDFVKEHPENPIAYYELAIIVLVHIGVISPCQSDEAIVAVKDRCHALNKYICSRSKVKEEIATLASPVTGCGLNINRFDQVFISGYLEGKRTAEQLAENLWKIFKSQGLNVVIKGQTVATEEENLFLIKNNAQQFLTNVLPVLSAAQVI